MASSTAPNSSNLTPSPLRPPESVALRQCPDQVDGRKAFITRQITVEYCENLQKEGFHACGGCVHAQPATVARSRAALDSLLGQTQTAEAGAWQSSDDPYGLALSAARTWADLEEAYCLVFRAFTAEGLPETGPAKLRLDCFNRQASARTFLIRYRNKLAGVLTVLPDSPLGLPADELYHTELKALRESGRRLCGFSSLAVEADDHRLARAVRLHLFRAAWHYACQVLNASDICTLVPARHEMYYRKMFMFERLGERRIYALGGQRSQAVGVRLNLDLAPQYFKATYDQREGAHNLYRFFVKQDAEELSAFVKKLKNIEIAGQIGGFGYPALPVFRFKIRASGRVPQEKP